MASSDVKSVSLDGRSLSKPTALPSKADLPVPTEIPRITPEEGDADAVKIDVSGIAAQQAAKEGRAAEQKQPKSEGSFEVAQKLAENIRAALQDIKSTKVSFDVSIAQRGDSTLSFQVIDTESGEVVREFPPEVAESLNHRSELSSGKGLLVEEAA